MAEHLLPMFSTGTNPNISFQRMKQILADLAPQYQRLSTDLPLFKRNARSLCVAVAHLINSCQDQPERAQKLLQREPQLLEQLLQLATASLQQLAVRVCAEPEVCKSAALVCDSLGWLLTHIRGRDWDVCYMPSTPADASKLRLMKDTGLLRAYTSAAPAAASFFNSNPTIHRLSPRAAPQQRAAHLLSDPVQLLAAASTSMLCMWCSISEFTSTLELMQPHSPVIDTVLPSAGLAMAIARAYAGDKVFAAPALFGVLRASVYLARASIAFPGHPAEPNSSMLAEKDVYELLLLGLAAGAAQLHAEQGGMSRRTLLPSLRTSTASSGNNSSSSGGGGNGSSGNSLGNNSSSGNSSSKAVSGGRKKPGWCTVPPHHQEVLQALLGVRNLAGLHPSSAGQLLTSVSLLTGAVQAATTARHRDAYGMANSSTTISTTTASSKQAVREGERVPRQLALPLHLLQIEVAALAPNFADRLSVMQGLLQELESNGHQLRALVGSPGNLPAVEKLQAQLCLASLWLQLGPVLLSICRRHSGEVDEDGGPRDNLRYTFGPGATPRQLFAIYTQVLANMLSGQVGRGATPRVNAAAVVQKDPILCSIILEAAFHAAPAHHSCSTTSISNDWMVQACNAPYMLGVAVDFLAEATASSGQSWEPSSAAAAATTSSGAPAGAAAAAAAAAAAPEIMPGAGSPLAQELFSMIVAAVTEATASRGLPPASAAAALAAIAAAPALRAAASKSAAGAPPRAPTGAPTGAAAAAAAGEAVVAAAAAPVLQGAGSPLAQQLFSVLVAAFNFLQCKELDTTARECSASLVLSGYYNRVALFCSATSAVHRMLGDIEHSRVHMYGMPEPTADAAAGAPSSTAAQLVWFNALGRSLIAAAHLLQQLPAVLTASESIGGSDVSWPLHMQYKNIFALTRLAVVSVMRMQAMLQDGGAAAAAVAAGAEGAAATPADLARLLQDAAGLLQELHSKHRQLAPRDYLADGSWAGSSLRTLIVWSPLVVAEGVSSLRVACESGQLLQQLRSFGVSCCSCFPQPGVCGNPACINLDNPRFSEASLANKGCQGCNRAVKFCGSSCHKAAWKSGHKAACAVLQQRQAAAAAAEAPAAAPAAP